MIRLWPEANQGPMRRWVNLLCLCFALSALRAVAASPSEIAITHVSVIDVRAGTIKLDMTVLIQGDRITAVRPSKDNEGLPTKEIKVIDGRRIVSTMGALEKAFEENRGELFDHTGMHHDRAA